MTGNIIKLIIKDFRALWAENRTGLIVLILSTLWSAFCAPVSGIIWLIFMLLNIYAYMGSLFSLDVKYRNEGFFASFPVSRKEIVLSRFGGVMIIFSVYAVLTYLMDMKDILHYGEPDRFSVPAGYYLSFFLSAAFLSSAALPLYFQMGRARIEGLDILIVILLFFYFKHIWNGMDFKDMTFTNLLFSFDTSMCLSHIGLAVLLLGLSVPLTIYLYSRKAL